MGAIRPIKHLQHDVPCHRPPRRKLQGNERPLCGGSQMQQRRVCRQGGQKIPRSLLNSDDDHILLGGGNTNANAILVHLGSTKSLVVDIKGCGIPPSIRQGCQYSPDGGWIWCKCSTNNCNTPN